MNSVALSKNLLTTMIVLILAHYYKICYHFGYYE